MLCTSSKPRVKIAAQWVEFQAAFTLVYQAYLRSGLTRPNPFQMRVTPFHLLRTTQVFIATTRDDVVCTMSLVREGRLGLPIQTLYREEVAARQRLGIRLGEVSCLADQNQGKEGSFLVVVQLMSLMAQCAKRQGVDELLITVHPRHAPFYQRFIGFEIIGEEKSYSAVCDRPAVALALDLNRLHLNHPRAHKRFFGTPFPEDVLNAHPISRQIRERLQPLVYTSEVFAADAREGDAEVELSAVARTRVA